MPVPPDPVPPDPVPAPRQGSPPREVRTAALVTAAEAGALVLLGVLFALNPLRSPTENLLGAELGAGLTLLSGALLAVLARAVARVRGWARSPLVVSQLVVLPVGFSLAFQAGLPQYGLPVLLLAGTVLYQLATPAARLAFADA